VDKAGVRLSGHVWHLRHNTGNYSALVPISRHALIVELRRQSACFENNDRFIVVLTQIRVSRAGKSDDTELCLRQPLGRPSRRVCRFAGDGRIGLQAIASAGNIGLNDVDGLSGHGLPAAQHVGIRL